MARTKHIRFVRALTITAAAAVALVSLASSAETASPFVGKWVVNIAKSTFEPMQPPKSNTATITEAPGGGLHTSIDIVEADGSKTHMEYTASPGGPKAIPVTGASDYADSIVLTQVNSHTMKYSLSKAGKVVESGTMVVSKSGKTMQGSLSGTFQNAPWKDHFVYDRE